MNIKVNDLMIKQVVSTVLHKSMEHAIVIMKSNAIKLIPVVNTENEVVEIVSSADLLGTNDNKPISQVMKKDVVSIPAYYDIAQARSSICNGHIHL